MKRRGRLVVLVLLTVVLAGCGASDGTRTVVTPPPESTPETPTLQSQANDLTTEATQRVTSVGDRRDHLER